MEQVITILPQARPLLGRGAPGQPPLIAYEERMNRDPRWAMSEASEFFEGKGSVQTALRKITARLNSLGVPYAVVGGMALFHHGFRRYTEDVDILVTRAGLTEIHDKLEGLGYVPPFAGSKNLRDAENGVKIEFLLEGSYPGDGKEKPIAFPDPAKVCETGDGISYLNLPTLISLKLASGMTDSNRIKDIGDVQELIKILNLPAEFVDKLDPFVRLEFTKLWHASRPTAKRYVLLWRNKWLTAQATNVEEMAARLREAADTLQAMLADGVTLDPGSGTADDYAHLVTTDPDVARKYDMHDESDFLDQ